MITSVNKRYAFKPSMAIVFVLRPHTLHSWCHSPVNGLDVCEVLRRATKILGEGRGGEEGERREKGNLWWTNIQSMQGSFTLSTLLCGLAW